jgi:cytochrome c-type biogenesis protein
MLEISFAFILSSFIAGLLTFLAPCTLPLVPAYLGFISGVNTKDLEDPEKALGARRKIFLNGVFFIIGFSLVFIIFGTLAGLLGQALVPYRIWLARLGGAFIIIFGLFMLGVFNLNFLQVDRRVKTPNWLKLGRPSSSFIVGGAFAFGWTPCVGPILGSILLLASTSTTAIEGATLLAIFSLGLSIPFIFVALAYSKATMYLKRINKYLKWVSVIGGIFLIILGGLLITDNFGLTIQYGYRIFDFIHYDKLLDFL